MKSAEKSTDRFVSSAHGVVLVDAYDGFFWPDD